MFSNSRGILYSPPPSDEDAEPPAADASARAPADD